MTPPFVVLVLPIVDQGTDIITYYPPSIVPQQTEGLDIIVLTSNSPSGGGGFDMTGYTATLLLSLEGQITPVVLELPLTVEPYGTAAVYTTVGGEFPKPGYYDAQLKIFASEVLLYSLTALKQLKVEAVQG